MGAAPGAGSRAHQSRRMPGRHPASTPSGPHRQVGQLLRLVCRHVHLRSELGKVIQHAHQLVKVRCISWRCDCCRCLCRLRRWLLRLLLPRPLQALQAQLLLNATRPLVARRRCAGRGYRRHGGRQSCCGQRAAGAGRLAGAQPRCCSGHDAAAAGPHAERGQGRAHRECREGRHGALTAPKVASERTQTLHSWRHGPVWWEGSTGCAGS